MKIEKKKPKAEKLTIRLTPEQKTKLAELAEKHGVSVSTLVIELLSDAYCRATRRREF